MIPHVIEPVDNGNKTNYNEKLIQPQSEKRNYRKAKSEKVPDPIPDNVHD
jgi:hypothetical protein